MSLTSIRQLLTEHDFDWENGAIIVPGGKAENIFLSSTSVALDRQFDLEDSTKQQGAPIFTAEDPLAMYLLCNYPEVTVFQKVLVSDLEGLTLGGIRGYPYGSNNPGIDLNFTQGVVEVFVTNSKCYPSLAGCPEIHFYCIASDKKDVMDTFTMRLLTGYIAVRKEGSDSSNNGVKQRGYKTLLENFFYNKLGVEEKILPPLLLLKGE